MAADSLTNYRINPINPVKSLRVVSLATVNNLLVSPVPANILAIIIQNNTVSGTKVVKLYNKVTAPVAGTDVAVASFIAPPGQTWTHNIDAGLACNLGLGMSMTGGVAENDTTALAANDIVVTLLYATG